MAAAAVPADALDNACHLLETTIRDVTVVAQGLTKDALNLIKAQLLDVLPSLSPAAITTKMVDEAEKETIEMSMPKSERGEEEINDHDQPPRHDDSTGQAPFVSPAPSLSLNRYRDYECSRL